ncbi:carboxymuconolactone decarboxylase family protein [Actinoallomurus acanthiterrae]
MKPADATSAAAQARIERGTQQMRTLGLTNTPDLIVRLHREHPALADQIVAFIFGDLYSRTALTASQRQLVTLGCLTALGDTGRQLQAHADLALSVGLTSDEIREAILHAGAYAGFPRAISASLAVTSVLDRPRTSNRRGEPQ